MLQNILFSGTSFWWLPWGTEPRARGTCRSSQIQKADQLCNVQWITLQVTFMHKQAKGKKKTQNFYKICRSSACAERVNSMWKLPSIADFAVYTGINWSLTYLVISLKFFDFCSAEIWFKFLLIRNAAFIHYYKYQTMFRNHTFFFFSFACKEIEIWNKNQHMDE